MYSFLVTGSHGFVGSRLTKEFHKLVITVPHELLYDVHALASFIPKDIKYIYHCAAYGNMAHQQDIDGMVRANILALNNLMMATESIPYKAFINFSSSSVYGPKQHPMHETNSLDATDYYGVTKIAGELLVRAFVTRTGKPIVNVRPFSIYGPKESSYRFIPTAIRAIKKKEPFTLAHGMHDWIYIDDFIEAVKLVVEHAHEYKGLAVNIGTGIETDNYEVMRLLCMIANRDIDDIPFTPISEMRSRNHWQADNTLLRSIGWTFRTSLREGLKKCYESQ